MPSLGLDSPLGPLTVTEEQGAIVRLAWSRPKAPEATALLTRAAAALTAYFARRAFDFDLPYAPAGSDFQRRVWQEISRIPLGETRSYGALAARLGSAPRAVGGACGANPIPILIPCHRVLAAGGRAGGYSGKGGLATKRFLLAHEIALAKRP